MFLAQRMAQAQHPGACWASHARCAADAGSGLCRRCGSVPGQGEAIDLGVGVPPQVLGLEVGIDDGVRQAVFAVEVLGLVSHRVDFGD